MDYRDVKKRYWAKVWPTGTIISCKDLLAQKGPRKPRHGERWGNWEWDSKTKELLFMGVDGTSGPCYSVYLDEMKTSAQCLDWIFQTYQKRWCSRDDAHALLDAIKDLVNPQARLCSFGVERNEWKKAAS